jgi:hypothetical protein
MGNGNFLSRRQSCFHYEFAIKTRLIFTPTFQDLITLPIFTTLKLSALSNENISYQGNAASVIMSEFVWSIAGTSLRRKIGVLKTGLVSLCPPQIPHGLASE